MTSVLPMIPGLVTNHDHTRDNKKSNARVSAQKQDANRYDQFRPKQLFPVPKEQQYRKEQEAVNKTNTSATEIHENFWQNCNIDERFEPSWVKMDRHVLCFYGQFYENVHESRIEVERLRKVIIYLQLEDNTIAITEPRIMNAGTPQGIFLKRQNVMNSDNSGKPLCPENFIINQNILICGRNISIIGCDQYTREFCELNFGGIPNNNEQEISTFDVKLKEDNIKFRKKDLELKNYMEFKLGGGKRPDERQFLANDRNVLRFQTVNQSEMYVVHQFLADDQIEVREMHKPNTGRDQFPLLLRKQKLKQNYDLPPPGLIQPTTTLEEKDIVDEIDVQGTVLTIIGVDQFTKDYYKSLYDRNFELYGYAEPFVDKNLPIMPPQNGFGDEVDTEGQVYRLVPKPPVKDNFKFLDDKGILKFEAKFNTSVVQDKERRFIFSFYLNEDTLSVNEPPVRNSGQLPGKFLHKKQYKLNPNYNGDDVEMKRFIEPRDLLPNNNVTINQHKFQILKCDDQTKNWFKDNYDIEVDC